MSSEIRIIGVHPVRGPECCYLIEIVVRSLADDLDFGSITQENLGIPPDNWQVPWDEQILMQSQHESRFAFFFHYLDLTKPLITPFGAVLVPEPTPVPKHLAQIQYEPPC